MSSLKKSYPYYLANKPVYANEKLKVFSKVYPDKILTSVAEADEKTIDLAIEKADKVQHLLRKMPSYERKAILEHVVKRVKERYEEFAVALCLEAGKPIKDARGEVDRLIQTFEIAAEEAVRFHGEFGNMDISSRAANTQYATKRFPISPISMISPFNFPLNLAAHKIAPAIAVGSSWVLKPASKTPIGALMIGEILSETSLPEGSFSILPCSRSGADLFTIDERFKVVSFTGSPEVGWALKKKAGKKKVILELGGNAAVIVDKDQESDADLKYACSRILFGAFYQSGQSCISVQRVLVHEQVYEKLKKLLIEETIKLVKGDPMDEKTFIGPMISEAEAKRIEEWVNEAVEKGAKVLCGGKREGTYYDATIVENCPKSAKLVSEEAFAPVFVLSKFSNFKEAIAAVNDSKFGLQAGVFTKNIHKTFYAFDELEVGGVVINDVPSVRIDSQPYGGLKESGLGREGIKYAMEDYTELKVMLLRSIGGAKDSDLE